MRVFIYGLVVLVMIGCKTTSNNTIKNELKKISFKTISKSALYGDGYEEINESNFVITGTKAWDLLLFKLNSVNNVSSNFKQTPVKFSKEIIIGVFDKVRSTGGFSIKINKIAVQNDTTKILYSIKKPAFDELVSTVMTQPYHLVKIQQREGVFVFIKEDK